MRMRVLMIAPPGAGKGTQGALIAAHFGIPHIVGTHHEFRRRGLARAVMLHAMRQMQEGGMRRVTVNHLADNVAALRLYEAIGFAKQHETLGFRRARSVEQN